MQLKILHMLVYINMRLLPIFLVVLIFFACQNKRPKHSPINSAKPVQINLDEFQKYRSLHTVIDTIWFVSLAANDSVTSQQIIDKLFLHDKMIYTIDIRHSSIKVFDLSGKYQYDMGGLGIKKGRYRKIADIAYNKFRNSIYVLCNSPAKTVYEYSVEGNFIREIHLANGASALGIENANTYYYYLNHGGEEEMRNYNLAKIDSNNTIKDTFFDLPANIDSRIGFTGGIYVCQDSLYFNPPLTNTFYSLSNSAIGRKCFFVSFGKDNLPKAFQSVNDLVSNIHKYSHLGKSLVIGTDFIGFNFIEKGGLLKQAFYNINSKYIAKIDSSSPLNSLFHYDIFQSHDTLMTVTYMRELKKWIIGNKKIVQAQIPGLYEKILDQKSSDNPVVIFYKLKSF